MINIWKNNEPELLLSLPPGPAAPSLCVLANLTHILESSLWIWPCMYSVGGGCVCVCAVILHAFIDRILIDRTSTAVVVQAAGSDFMKCEEHCVDSHIIYPQHEIVSM